MRKRKRMELVDIRTGYPPNAWIRVSDLIPVGQDKFKLPPYSPKSAVDGRSAREFATRTRLQIMEQLMADFDFGLVEVIPSPVARLKLDFSTGTITQVKHRLGIYTYASGRKSKIAIPVALHRECVKAKDDKTRKRIWRKYLDRGFHNMMDFNS